jgi:hypothetical protein
LTVEDVCVTHLLWCERCEALDYLLDLCRRDAERCMTTEYTAYLTALTYEEEVEVVVASGTRQCVVAELDGFECGWFW